MKALAIRQPWASAIILHAGKDTENRDWPTRFRGSIAVHAAKGCASDEYFAAFKSIRDIVGHQRLDELKWPGITRAGWLAVRSSDLLTWLIALWIIRGRGFRVIRALSRRSLEALRLSSAGGHWGSGMYRLI